MSTNLTRTDRSMSRRAAGGLAVLALVVTACGGGDDDGDTTEPPSTTAAAGGATTQSTAPAPTAQTTQAPASTVPAEPNYVTKGAKVVVANASRIDGGAGRLSERLGDVGYNMGQPTNSSASYQRIEATEIHYAPGKPKVKKVAQSLKAALGGGNIKLVELASPAPTESGNVPAGVSVIILMGNDTADQSLAQLQGREEPEETDDSSADDSETDDTTADDTTADSTSPSDTTADE